MGCSPTGSPVPGIFQARIPKWVASSFSRGSSQPRVRNCIIYTSYIDRQVFCLFVFVFFNNSTTWETSQNMCPTIISPHLKHINKPQCQNIVLTHFIFLFVYIACSQECIQFRSVTRSCPTLATLWTAARSLPCTSPTPGAYSSSRPLSRWCHPTNSSSVNPFSSCLQSFPASGFFQMSQFFISGSQSIGASASTSVLPINIRNDFFRMDWLDLLAVQGTLKSLLQHHSLKTSILWHSAFFIVQFSYPYMTTGKT